MLNLKTDPDVMTRIAKAAAKKQTAEDIRQQRISYIMGFVDDNSGVTRAQVQEVLAGQEGKSG